MLSALALLSLAATTTKAQAQEPAPSEAVVSSAKDGEARTWYGLPILAIDVAAIGAFVGGALEFDHSADMGGALMLTGIGGYVLGGPIVHFSERRTGKGVASFALRVMAPPTGAALGALVGSAFDSCHSDSCDPTGLAVGAILGFIGGLLVGSAVDNAVLALKPATSRQMTLLVLPIYKPTTGQTGLALRGIW